MGVMKMGNIVPGAGIEAIFITFHASVLTNTPPRLPYVAIAPTPTCLGSSLPESSVKITTLFIQNKMAGRPVIWH